MHTLNPFGNRVTAYPVKTLAILANRGRLPASHTLSNIHMPNTRSLAVEGVTYEFLTFELYSWRSIVRQVQRSESAPV